MIGFLSRMNVMSLLITLCGWEIAWLTGLLTMISKSSSSFPLSSVGDLREKFCMWIWLCKMTDSVVPSYFIIRLLSFYWLFDSLLRLFHYSLVILHYRFRSSSKTAFKVETYTAHFCSNAPLLNNVNKLTPTLDF